MVHLTIVECVLEDNAYMWKVIFTLTKKEKNRKKKRTQVPLFVSSGNCSIYLRTKINLNDFPYHIGINMRLFFVKSNVSISFLLAFMMTPEFGFKKNEWFNMTNLHQLLFCFVFLFLFVFFFFLMIWASLGFVWNVWYDLKILNHRMQ